MDRKVTSRDVARAAGVSQALVSLILNNVPDVKIKPETRQHVLETASKLNYRVNINARNMKNRKAGAIGLLSTWTSGSFVFPPAIDGVQSVCSEEETGVILCTGKKGLTGNPDYIDYYLQNRIDGLIFLSYVGINYEGVIEELSKYAVPFVCMIGARDIPGVSCVDVSFLDSGILAARHLAESGYTRAAYLLPAKPDRLIYAEKERLEGCIRGAAESGIKLELCEAFIGHPSGRSMEERAIDLLHPNFPFDSVISVSFGCQMMLKAAVRCGVKVPEDLGVISLDNELYAPFLYPSLSTVDEPLVEMARRATHILLDKIEGFKGCEKVELPPLLSVRESTQRTKKH